MSDIQYPAKLVVPLILLVLSTLSHAQESNTPISQSDIREAEKLFSGPTEEDLYRTDEMLVSATGSLKPVILAPSVATVITKEKIKAMGATNLNEVLESVPGLHVAPSNLVGTLFINYSIRGIVTSLNPQVLLLINGVPIKEYLNGTREYRFSLPVEMISRVEVIRGPGSAIFGADAFAGTVNVITKDGQEIDGVHAGIRHGSSSTTDIWTQYGKKTNGWDVVASFEAHQNGTDSARVIDADLQTSLDGSLGTSASRAPGTINNDLESVDLHLGLRKNEWNFSFFGRHVRNAGAGFGVAAALDPTGQVESDRYRINIKYQNDDLYRDWKLGASFNYDYYDLKTKYSLLPAGTIVPIGSDGNLNPVAPVGLVSFTDGILGNPNEQNKVYTVETVAVYDGSAQHNVRFALGHTAIKPTFSETKNFGPGVINGTQPVVDGTLTDVTGTAFVFAPDVTRRLWYVSAQDEWAFAKHWELTAGVRYDNYSDFGGTTNPRLALVWQTRYDLVTKLLYGRAFRAPTLSELYVQNNPIDQGNPNLDPETIDTLELAVDYRPTVDLTLKANIFAYEINDLIDLVPDIVGNKSTYQNVRNQEGYGAEAEVDWEVSNKLQLRGNIAWQRGKDKATDADVPDTPQLQVFANANWKFLPGWSADVQWYWIGDRERAVGDTRNDIKDYHVTHVSLRRKELVKDIDVAIGVRNVFDKDLREPTAGSAVPASIPNDIPLDGRAIWVELRGHY